MTMMPFGLLGLQLCALPLSLSSLQRLPQQHPREPEPHHTVVQSMQLLQHSIGYHCAASGIDAVHAAAEHATRCAHNSTSQSPTAPSALAHCTETPPPSDAPCHAAAEQSRRGSCACRPLAQSWRLSPPIAAHALEPHFCATVHRRYAAIALRLAHTTNTAAPQAPALKLLPMSQTALKKAGS